MAPTPPGRRWNLPWVQCAINELRANSIGSQSPKRAAEHPDDARRIGLQRIPPRGRFHCTPSVVSMACGCASRCHIRGLQGILGDTRRHDRKPDHQPFVLAALAGDRQALERVGLRPLPPIPAPVPLHLVAPEGQPQVHTASYRGSFRAFSVRRCAAGLGSRVLIAQFLQGAGRLCAALWWSHLAASGDPGMFRRAGQPCVSSQLKPSGVCRRD